MKIKQNVALKGNRGVDDFDTSSLPGGRRPRHHEYYGRKYRSTDRTSRLTGARVETLRDYEVNGYHVTVSRYNKDDSCLQVIIDSPGYSNTVTGTVSSSELNQFIADNTGRR